MIQVLAIYFVLSGLVYSRYGPSWIIGQAALLIAISILFVMLGVIGALSLTTVFFTITPMFVAVPITIFIQTAWSFYWMMLSR